MRRHDEASACLAYPILSQRYRVGRLLKSGGMGEVHLAEDVLTGSSVVVKLLRSDLLDDRSLCRFFLEARTGLILAKSPRVVRLLDIGFSDKAVPFLVMEHLEGQDLGQILKRGQAIDAAAAVEMMLDICAGVADVHGAGVIHRDLKPSNIFVLESSPRVRLLDFGISKLLPHAEDLTLTRTGELMGSIAYIAPERLRDPDDARAAGDVWALGVILFELLMGSLPFKGRTSGALKEAIQTQELPNLDELGERNFSELDTVLRVALHKDPRYRYPTVADFSAALRRAAFDAGLLDEPGEADGALHQDVPSATDRSEQQSTPPVGRPVRRIRRRAIVAAVAIVVLGAALAATAFRSKEPSLGPSVDLSEIRGDRADQSSGDPPNVSVSAVRFEPPMRAPSQETERSADSARVPSKRPQSSDGAATKSRPHRPRGQTLAERAKSPLPEPVFLPSSSTPAKPDSLERPSPTSSASAASPPRVLDLKPSDLDRF